MIDIDAHRIAVLETELARARAQQTRAEIDLLKYGRHLPACNLRKPGAPCECGWHDAFLRASTSPRWPMEEPPLC